MKRKKIETPHESSEMEENKNVHEITDFEQEEVIEELEQKVEKVKDLPSFETVVDSIPFHNFDENPVFTGFYIEKFKVADIIDRETNEPIPFMALKFIDYNTNEYVALRINYSIVKALEKAHSTEIDDEYEHLFNIEFLGKTEVKGKPFNQYKIGIAPVQIVL